MALQVGAQLLPHWEKFFGSPSLFQCMHHDPALEIRLAAGQCIFTMVSSAQKVLENTPLIPLSSFPSEPRYTSLAGKLLHWLDYLHESCLSPLRREVFNIGKEPLWTTSELTQSIKVVTVLTTSFKYESRPQKLKEVFTTLTTLGTHSKDSIVINECLHSLWNILEAGCSLDEFISIIITLVEKNIHLSTSWVLLSSLCCFKNMNCLQEYSTSLFNLSVTNPTDSVVVDEKCKYIEKCISLFPENFFCKENSSFVDQWIVPRLQAQDGLLPSEIACSCACIAAFPSIHFEQLEPKRQIFFMTTLLHHATSSNVCIKGAACRALGVLTSFTCLHEDTQFLMDIKQVLLEASNDPHVQVKSNVAWSLTQLLALYEQKVLDIDSEALLELLQKSIQLAHEHDKCKVHALRLLAILYPISRTSQLQEKLHTIILKNIHKGAFKTRWNACRTAESVLRFQEVPSLIQGVLDVLDVRNFKILIHATKALKYAASRKEDVIQRLHKLEKQYENDTSVYYQELMSSIHGTIQYLGLTNEVDSATSIIKKDLD
ncbi:HEAT repeat-containing protein 6 [Coelomomyces lativittatus]|nr:HEAT repeat-containing protein 6 [Coelomomyces lativittatus]